MKKSYKIEVDCANCASRMEDAAKKIEGVKDASVNFMMLKMKVVPHPPTSCRACSPPAATSSRTAPLISRISFLHDRVH